MLKTLLAAGVAASALAGIPAAAQTPTQNGFADTDRPGTELFIPQRAPGVLRASDFVGRRVYNLENRAIGSVEDVLFGPDGRMNGLVIEVGGFLGVGAREIAIPLNAFRIDPGSTATTGTVGGISPSTQAGADTRSDLQMSPVVYPERIILPIRDDDLRSAPQFQDRNRVGSASEPQAPVPPRSGASAPSPQ